MTELETKIDQAMDQYFDRQLQGFEVDDASIEAWEPGLREQAINDIGKQFSDSMRVWFDLPKFAALAWGLERPDGQVTSGEYFLFNPLHAYQNTKPQNFTTHPGMDWEDFRYIDTFPLSASGALAGFSTKDTPIGSTVYYLDSAFHLHRMRISLAEYYSLALNNMGITHWQYAYVDNIPDFRRSYIIETDFANIRRELPILSPDTDHSDLFVQIARQEDSL